MTGLKKYQQELITGLEALDFDYIQKAAEVIFGAWQQGNSVYIFGNGHSASTSEAFAADLRKWPQTKNNRGVKAHALTLLPLMTAYANDIDYQEVFLQQLLGVAEYGDVAIGITCGGSKNVIAALNHKTIREKCKRIGIIGVVPYLEFPVNILIQCRAPDIRQQEDIMSAVCHMICGEVKTRIEEHLARD